MNPKSPGRGEPAKEPIDGTPSVRPPPLGSATVLRSADHVRVPQYPTQSVAQPQAIISEDVLRQLGVARTRTLTADEARALVKVPSDLSLVMPELITLLRQEPGLFSTGTVTPELIEQTLSRVEFLAPRAAAASEVSKMLDDQLSVASSDLGDLAFRVRRRVYSQSDEDPSILDRWEKVLRYLDRLVPGPKNPHKKEDPPAPK